MSRSTTRSSVENPAPDVAWRYDEALGLPAVDRQVRVVFAGRGLPRGREAALRALLPEGIDPAWVRQVHGRAVVEADRPAAGECGEADALVTGAPGLALSVVTADCVPILLANRSSDRVRIAAVHAGWRGVAARIVPSALERLGGHADTVVAWIGPCISGEVYEVGDEVAGRVAEVSDPSVALPSPEPGGKVHLDLRRAVEIQLRAAGVQDVRHVDLCTLHHPDLLHSYRRDGDAAGRNVAAILIEP